MSETTLILTPERIDVLKSLRFAAAQGSGPNDNMDRLMSVVIEKNWIWASDAYRIAACRIKDGPNDIRCPIPLAALDVLPGRDVAVRFEMKNGSKISLSWSDGKAIQQFTVDDPPAVTNLLDRKYDNQFYITFDREDLLKTLKSFTQPLVFGNTYFTDVDGKTVAHQLLPQVSFDPMLLRDGIERVGQAAVVVMYGDEHEPLKIVDNETDFVFMVMPYRADNGNRILADDRLGFIGQTLRDLVNEGDAG